MKTSLLRDAIRSALVAGAAMAVSLPALAQDAESAPTSLDRIQVTGSRIRQVDMETAQPVLTITRQDIEGQGFSTCPTSANMTRRFAAIAFRPLPRVSVAAITITCATSANRPLLARQAPWHHTDGPAVHCLDSLGHGRAHRDPEGRRLVDLRLRRDGWRRQHHHPQEFRRLGGQRLLRAVQRRRRRQGKLRLHHGLRRRARFDDHRRRVPQ